MTNRKILDYAIKGMYNDIKRLEKELRIVNGTLYRINCNKVTEGKYEGYTSIKLQGIRNELKQDIKELKKEYNQLVFDVDRKNLQVIYLESEVAE